ncbi:hypothetical protein [Vagococcus fluvialis]|uniref:hypothetical protein n=1 Tax=Vagococcus fluvialis TaxID=2738 RepID=UPI001A8EDC8E|nr:hypothetical protein [Vagococcus fluvialis]MBO0485942.1 hypothetical protein [Vagococcus fluvialis]
MTEKEKKEKIAFILAIKPKMIHIINFATDEQVQIHFEQAKQFADRELNEACYG